MYSLREYQLEGIAAVEREFSNGVRATLLEWATGLGKTVAAAEIIRRWHPLPCMFICHREELISQAIHKIESHTGLRCAREQAGHRVHPDFLFNQDRPVVASVQSLNAKWGDNAKRLHKFKPSLLIIDEVHHARADTYERVINHCGDNCKVLGITATPKRHDKKALGKFFQSVAHRYQLEEGVANGYLVDIAAEAIEVVGLDYSKLRIVAGDFDKKQLAEMMEVEETVQRMVHPSLEIIFGVNPRGSLGNLPPNEWETYLRSFGRARKTLMFCASVEHARLASEVFNRVFHGTKMADWICGETPTMERKERLDKFRSGQVPILCNMGIATEGFDEPSIELILHGRPTKSVALYVQMLGRGTRTLPGVIDGIVAADERKSAIKVSPKPFARSVDFVGNSDRLQLVTAVDVLGGDYSAEAKKRAIDRSLNKPVMIAVTLNNMEKQIQQEHKERRLAAERAELERRKGLVAAAKFHGKDVDLFKHLKSPAPVWHSVKLPSKANGATERQRYVMGKAGINPTGWTKKQAGMVLGILSQNDWRLPADPKYDWIRNHGKEMAT